MAAQEPLEELKELDATFVSIETVLEPEAMRASLATMETEATDPELWNDQERAQRVTSTMAQLRAVDESIVLVRHMIAALADAAAKSFAPLPAAGPANTL